jgi:hypothetical protein
MRTTAFQSGHLWAGKRIILKRILKKYDVRVWTGFNWLKMALVAGSCGHEN